MKKILPEKTQNSKRKAQNFTFYFLAVVFTFTLLLLPFPSFAQQVGPLLTVAPARQEILVDPGEQATINIKFLNQGDNPVAGTLKAIDFVVEDKEGSPIFLEEGAAVVGTTQISPRFSAASWFSLPYDRMSIAAKDRVLVQAKINVPEDANPGGRYVALVFETGGAVEEALGATKEATTPIAQRLAGLVYLRVAGPVKEDAYVVQFTAPQFSEYGPIQVTTEILNRGDYHIRPQGIIRVSNLFNRVVDEAKIEEVNIFPDTSRVLENLIGQKWMWGKYKLELSAAYGETGQVLTAMTSFWVFPWKATVMIALALIIIITLIILSYKRFVHREKQLEEKIEQLEDQLKK